MCTVIAEKLEAMIKLGYDNSRMKDFYDVPFLLRKFAPEPFQLRHAIQRTFARRGTPLQEQTPEVFQPEFVERKQTNALEAVPESQPAARRGIGFWRGVECDAHLP